MCLPAKQAAALGNIGPLVLVTRVTNAITLTDPLTLRQGEAPGGVQQPWAAPGLREAGSGGTQAPPSPTCRTAQLGLPS